MSHFYEQVELVSKGKIMRFERLFHLDKITAIRKLQFGRTKLVYFLAFISSYIMLPAMEDEIVRLLYKVFFFSGKTNIDIPLTSPSN